MATKFCMRCGCCVPDGQASLAEIAQPGSARQVALLCDACGTGVYCSMRPLPERELTVAARPERFAATSNPIRGGLDRGPDSFAPLVGRYRDAAPIRRRTS